MKQKPWMWQRLTDEQLEAAMCRWADREGAYWYAHEGAESQQLRSIVTNIIAEANRRCCTPRLFEVDGQGVLYGGPTAP